MVRPSGDHAGSRSATPGERVTLRVSPLEAGTVKMSPRASNATRTPVGDRAAVWMFLSTLAIRDRSCGNSPRRVIFTSLDLPDFRSYRQIAPGFSYDLK